MRLALTLVAGVLGCSDDGPAADPYKCIAAGGDACFQMPNDVIYATDADGVDVEPVLGCEPYVSVDSASPVTLSGTTVDANDAELAIGDVRLESFSNVELTAPLFDVTSDADGTWTATVGSMPSLAFGRASKAGQLDLFYLYGRIDLSQSQQMLTFQTATRAQVASLIELAGDRFLPGTSQLAAVAYDCAGNRLANVIANSSPATARNGSRLFEAGVRPYYGIEGSVPVLARRTERYQTSRSGTIAIANLRPGKHYIQLWGFPTEDDLLLETIGIKLLAEHEIYTFDGEAGVIIPLHARL